MTTHQVLTALETFAPLPLQEDWDNSGLQCGLTAVQCSGALLCLDVTPQALQAAQAAGCNLIVSHHPLIFRPLRHITGDDIVYQAIRAGITIAAYHTCLDTTAGGVNYEIATRLGIDTATLTPLTPPMVIGTLPQPLTAAEFLQRVKNTFHAHTVMSNATARPDTIRRLAICGGAGGSLIADAAAAGADAYLTGEIRYHDFQAHDDILLAAIGHYESEQYTVSLIGRIINKACPDVPIHTFTDTNPIQYT